MNLDDESAMTEITILPDGRVCLFGASRQILDVFDALSWSESSLKERLERLHAAESDILSAQETMETCQIITIDRQ